MRGVTLRHRIDGGLIVFQPALPMQGVTGENSPENSLSKFQPALPMRGVTHARHFFHADGAISTRTPHAGSDRYSVPGQRVQRISTRTPHAGSDHRAAPSISIPSYFNPHSPCGE